MQSSHSRVLRTAYDRYGPGTNRRDVGAGYAAVLAAVVATALYVASVAAIRSDAIGLDRTVYFAELEFHWVVHSVAVGLVFVVPAAFLVGFAGWNVLPSRTTLTGAALGAFGTIATYVVVFVLLALAVAFYAPFAASAEGASTGIVLWDALEVAFLSVVVGFVLTWWATVPIGCLTGLVYANRTGAAD
ncbi:hypothetical protein AB7C87_21830 [Natrarchaeobius sp. A-rgal3]|uniref:hypothetical protein n=1 Tax=Natrarchaeobius versutus TaxID=1679078 RepID=UPI0035102D7B